MPLILPGNVASATAPTTFSVANSCRFNSADSAYLSKTTGTATNTDQCTISFWVKRGAYSNDHKIIANYTDTNNRGYILFAGDSNLQVFQKLGGSTTINLKTNRLFRDHSAWYNIIVAVDTSQVTESDRVKIYVNGVQETSFSSETYPSQNENFRLNESSVPLEIGRKGEDAEYFNGYLSEFVLLDGQTLTPTSFGEFDEDSPTIWKPIDVSGLTFGDNGFYLDFQNSAELGTDVSGNSNTFTENNLDATDQATDTPTNNFSALNPLNHPNPSEVPTMSQGNCQGVSTDSGHEAGFATIGVSAGKWYAEFKLSASTSAANSLVGVVKDPISSVGTDDLDGSGLLYAVQANGSKYIAGSSTGAWADTFTTGDIIGVALDVDNSKIYFSKAGQWTDGDGNYDEAAPNAYVDLSAGDTWFFCPAEAANSWNSTWQADFGGCSAFTVSSANQDANGYGNFEYAVPSGYFALCTKNLAEYG